MISHALTIVINELQAHLSAAYNTPGDQDQVVLANIAEGFANNGGAPLSRSVLTVSMVNVREEKTLKNVPNQTRNDTTLKVVYENPPVFLNCQVLIVATHTNYTDALLALSRAIRFFQFKNSFTHDLVAPSSLTDHAPQKDIDKLETFKLIFDLHSPSMEEVNHLWGTLGGKQYPFVLYTLRMLELKFKAVQSESGLITEVLRDFRHKNSAAG